MKYLAIACSILMTASSAFAGDIDAVCSPWFVSRVEFDRGALPNSVTLEAAFAAASRNYSILPVEGMPVVIKNPSAEPLYVLFARDRAMALKIVNNKTYYTNYRVDVDTVASSKIGWHEKDDGGFEIPSWMLESLARVTFKGNCGDDRPKGTQAPEAQPFSIHFVHAGKSVAIPGKATYRLNEHYDPHAQANSPSYQHFLRKSENETLRRIPLIGPYLEMANDHRTEAAVAALTVLLVGLGWVADRRRLRRAN